MKLHEIFNDIGADDNKTIDILSAQKVTKENNEFLFSNGVRLVCHCRNTEQQEFTIWKMSNGHFNKSLMISGGMI
jgi:hypothetical protein